MESRGTLAYSFPYINRYSNRATFRVTWVRRQPRHATFWRRCVPAAPSCRILESLRASGAVMRHSGEPACQRARHATFWGACVPAAPSCDILESLRASGAVKRLFRVAACQRARQATFWRRCVPAEPSSEFLAPLCASGPVMRHFEEPACQRSRQASFWRRLRPSDAVKRLGDERKAEDVERHAHDSCHNDSATAFCNGSARGRGQGFGPEQSVELP